MKTTKNNGQATATKANNEKKSPAQVFTYNGTTFKMSATFKGYKTGVFGDRDNLTRPAFVVTISSDNGRTRFNFYASYNDYKNRVRELDRAGMRNALECFISDGMSYENAYNFIEFCDEFGYNTDSRRARQIYDACGRHHEAAARVLGEDYGEIWNAIQDEQ
jgi:hypothetical protein